MLSCHRAERSNAIQGKTKHEADFGHRQLTGSHAPIQPLGPCGSSLPGVLVASLSQENGKLRQSIALNRKLVLQVLMSMIPHIKHLNLGLCSANDEADFTLKQLNDNWERKNSF